MAIKKLFKAPNNISLKGSLHLPGDKSIGIRSLIILSQSYGISNISNISDGEDVQTALANIKKLKIINRNHLVVIHREKKSKDDIDEVLTILLSKNYGRSKILFGKLT